MCILCVIQKWSRRVATMLPWLVIPLIGLWALSQLLPPPFRFEITSPRLACVFVLLITLFWYEILMPQLSVWRVRRSAKLREIKRFEAIELQKLRKTATRRCRNCLTPYRDQNPGGGKFMCSCCGHISKRPVLDLHLPPDILNDLVGKGGKILNGKTWSGNGWMCGWDWLENGSWGGGPFSGKSSYLRKHGCGFFCWENHCLAERSYSRLFVFSCNVLTSFFWTILWVWRKFFRASSSMDDASTDAQSRGMLDRQGENEGNGHESRGVKARRKAEEKRLAKLTKEMLEEEERKQREEVLRLVEEQRRLRDNKTEPGKDSGKGSPYADERAAKKGAERRPQEKRKERDRGSSKSNSDAEELEKKAGKENERNKKSGSDRQERYRSSPESIKSKGSENGSGSKVMTAGNQFRANSGSRYFDRMSSSLLSSSRAFTGGGFFRKDGFASVSREQKFNVSVENPNTSMHKKDMTLVNCAIGRSNVNEDEKIVSHSALIKPQTCTSPKKTWQQLFASSEVSSSSTSDVMSRPNSNGKCLLEIQNPPFSCHHTTAQSFDNPISLGPSPPSTLAPISRIGITNPPSSSQAMFSKIGDTLDQLFPEEAEIFEDPCYVPNPISLLGPVSESLDNFQLDRNAVQDLGSDKLCAVKTISALPEIPKPAPIESPLSRSRFSDERNTISFPFPGVPKAQDSSDYVNNSGTWQMWNSSPLGQDTLSLIAAPVNWVVPPEVNDPIKEVVSKSVPRKTMASLFKNDEKVNSGTQFPQDVLLFGSCQNVAQSVESLPCRMDDPWLPQTFFGPPSSNENKMLLKCKEKGQNGLMDEIHNHSADDMKYEVPACESWATKDGSFPGPRDGLGNTQVINRPHIGGLYSTPDVQSLWSYDLN